MSKVRRSVGGLLQIANVRFWPLIGPRAVSACTPLLAAKRTSRVYDGELSADKVPGQMPFYRVKVTLNGDVEVG